MSRYKLKQRMMTKEEILEVGKKKEKVKAIIDGCSFFGVIKEFGYMIVKAGPGNVQRALVSIETDKGNTIYCHITDIESILKQNNG